MSNAHFAKTPSINIPRTKMKQSFDHKTSFLHGYLVPIDCLEVLPGDSIKLKLSSLIRMTSPIFPIMDNIEATLHAWFVPMRLLWEHTEEFYGANKTAAGPQDTIYEIPHAIFGKDASIDAQVKSQSLSDYLGKPIGDMYVASVLKERAYYLIWNEWFRAQQVTAPCLISTKDVDGSVAVNDGTLSPVGYDFEVGEVLDPTTEGSLKRVCKKFDYFTAATIAPQYGDAVLIPIGAEAPVLSRADDGELTEEIFVEVDPYIEGSVGLGIGSVYSVGDDKQIGEIVDEESGTQLKSRFVADLSKTVGTINDLRYAVQVQKYLERSNFGSRFFEMLANHYGVTSPDARLQRPEYLGGHKFFININQVLSTAGATTGADTKLGQPGAVSVTTDQTNLFTKAFVEPGYLMITIETKHDRTYSQGLMREDTRFNRFEFYSPEFANLGDQAIYLKEIFAGADKPDDVFGYQEHWAEYRYRPQRVSGLLNPNASDSLAPWTLSEAFENEPSLNDDFISEDREQLARALTSGDNGPDYIADFYFDYTFVRPMPAYTIPGLMDHFGVL